MRASVLDIQHKKRLPMLRPRFLGCSAAGYAACVTRARNTAQRLPLGHWGAEAQPGGRPSVARDCGPQPRLWH